MQKNTNIVRNLGLGALVATTALVSGASAQTVNFNVDDFRNRDNDTRNDFRSFRNNDNRNDIDHRNSNGRTDREEAMFRAWFKRMMMERAQNNNSNCSKCNGGNCDNNSNCSGGNCGGNNWR